MDPDFREIEKNRKEKKKAEQNGNLKEAALFCNYIGELLSKKGQHEEAISEHESELFMSEAINDNIGIAVAHRKIGECYGELGQYDKAVHHQKLHLRLAEAENNYVEMQRAFATIGRTYFIQAITLPDIQERRKVNSQAESAYRQSLEVCERLQSNISQKEYGEMKARLLLNLGHVYDNKGDVKNCADLLKQAIAIAQKHVLHEDLYRGQYSLAAIYFTRGLLSQALRFYELALKCAQKMKDKAAETDVLTQKALVFVQLGDFSAALRAGKKAYKISTPMKQENDRVAYILKTVVLMSRVSEELQLLKEDDYAARLSLYEKLGDLASHIENYKQALKCYHNMLKCAQAIGKTGAALLPTYVSLSQTYKDDKQYTEAIHYYYKELECQGESQEQMCRTWLSIAEAKELRREDYKSVKEACTSASECAQKAEHPKLQVQVLKFLSVYEANFHRDAEHRETLAELQQVKEQYDIASDDELSEPEDSQDITKEADIDLDDVVLTDTDSEEDEEYDRPQTAAGRPARMKRNQIKRNDKGETGLHRACIDGNLKKVKMLLSQNHPINPRDYCGWIPLHEAANHDRVEIVKVLLDHGAWINDRGGDQCSGITPLHDACNCGNVDVIKLMVKRGANIHVKDDEGNTPLDSLTDYLQRSQGIINVEDMTEIQSIQKLLRSSIRGNNPNLRLTTQSTSPTTVDDPDDSLPTLYHRRRRLESETRRGEEGSSMEDPWSRSQLPSSSTIEDRSNSPIRGYDDNDESDLPWADSFSQLSSRDSSVVDWQRTSAKKSGKRSRNMLDEDDKDNASDGDDVTTYRTTLKNPDLPALNDPKSVRSAYQNAIASMRMSATLRTQSQLQKPNKEQQKRQSGPGPALINEAEFVGDDWLIDDVGLSAKPSKRKRIQGNSVFTTSSMYKTKGDSTQERRSSHENKRRSREDSESSEQTLSGGTEVPVSDRGEADLGASLVREDAASGCDMDDIDLLFLGDLDDVSMMDHSQASRPPASLPRQSQASVNHPLQSEKSCRRLTTNRPRQSKLTNFGMRVISSGNTSTSPSCTPRPDVYRSQDSTQTVQSTAVLSQASTRPVMRLKVRIRDHRFLVPVPSTDHTIGWLREEVSERYYKHYSQRPQLVLATKDGAMLSSEDHVSDLLSNDEEIEGQVEGWKLTALPQRYADACKAQNLVVYRNVQNVLASAEGSQRLTLADLALSSIQILPVCKALQCQHSLKELHLQGNRVGDDGVLALSRVISTLPSLRLLNLTANQITATGLRSIVTALEASPTLASEKPLQVLERLELSFNPLGDTCTQTLASIIHHLPALAILKLQSCDFTLRLFQQHRLSLAESLQGSSVQHLDLAYNKLGSTGVELLLMSVSPARLLSLNLTAVLPSYTTNHMIKHLFAYITRPDCCLQQLVLDNCYLLPEHWLDVTKFINLNKTLEHLSMSANQKLSNNDITELLEAANQSETSRLISLVFTGCGISGPLASGFLDAVNNKLRHSHPLQHLEFTCQGKHLQHLDQQSLREIWTSRWADDAICDIGTSHVQLSTRDRQQHLKI